jgi:hypothetical protein
MWRSTIRTVDPLALASHAGWTTALRAQRSGSFSWWQRGDIAIPVEMTHGTIVPCADTWARNGGGAYLCRNSLISVDRSGVVEWISSGNGEGLAGGTAIPGDATGRWFWPAGGFPVAATDLMLFGSMYSPGGLFGTLVGPYMAKISGITDTHPTDPVLSATGLDTAIHWGNPALFEDVVHIAGFKAVSAFEWHHYLARHAVATTAAGYSSSSGWTVTELTLDVDSPLTSLRLMPWRNGWLATAKILPSAPELGYGSRRQPPLLRPHVRRQALRTVGDQGRDRVHHARRPSPTGEGRGEGTHGAGRGGEGGGHLRPGGRRRPARRPARRVAPHRWPCRLAGHADRPAAARARRPQALRAQAVQRRDGHADRRRCGGVSEKSFVNVTSDGNGRATVELHHEGTVTDISHLISSITWSMEALHPAKLTLFALRAGRAELEAAVPEGLTVRFE